MNARVASTSSPRNPASFAHSLRVRPVPPGPCHHEYDSQQSTPATAKQSIGAHSAISGNSCNGPPLDHGIERPVLTSGCTRSPCKGRTPTPRDNRASDESSTDPPGSSAREHDVLRERNPASGRPDGRDGAGPRNLRPERQMSSSVTSNRACERKRSAKAIARHKMVRTRASSGAPQAIVLRHRVGRVPRRTADLQLVVQ